MFLTGLIAFNSTTGPGHRFAGLKSLLALRNTYLSQCSQRKVPMHEGLGECFALQTISNCVRHTVYLRFEEVTLHDMMNAGLLFIRTECAMKRDSTPRDRRFASTCHACGYSSPNEFSGEDIMCQNSGIVQPSFKNRRPIFIQRQRAGGIYFVSPSSLLVSTFLKVQCLMYSQGSWT